jgi:hypothetical protein
VTLYSQAVVRDLLFSGHNINDTIEKNISTFIA